MPVYTRFSIITFLLILILVLILILTSNTVLCGLASSRGVRASLIIGSYMCAATTVTAELIGVCACVRAGMLFDVAASTKKQRSCGLRWRMWDWPY